MQPQFRREEQLREHARRQGRRVLSGPPLPSQYYWTFNNYVPDAVSEVLRVEHNANPSYYKVVPFAPPPAQNRSCRFLGPDGDSGRVAADGVESSDSST